MLLARNGYRVILVDRATFPSDTMRAHFVRGGAISRLDRWGLLDQVAATGCPPLRHLTVDLGDFPMTMPVSMREGVEAIYGPRRVVLDAMLVDAAIAAGAEFRERFTVNEVLHEHGRVTGIRGSARGGAEVIERAPLVVGADGQYSLVARAVAAPEYDHHPTSSCCYYSYFADAAAPAAGARIAYHPNLFVASVPTNDDLTLVAMAVPIARFPAFRADIEGVFFSELSRIPWLADTIRPECRAERWRGTGDLPAFFRKPFGPGWALVGDAGYHRDPIPAQGISDAFRDAEFLADAIDAGFTGRTPLEEAMVAYEQRRNVAARPTFEESIERASFLPFPPEVYAQRAALRAAA
jgi:2-polyprenyl-6-methoxyphenol hydroxylase-like FAD-dependent oxidoreductase